MSKVVLVTNIPVPYREAVHEHVSEKLSGSYTVLYCCPKEPNRQWTIKYGRYRKEFLSKNTTGYIHNNFGIFKALNRLNPEVIVTTGFNPTMLYTFLWSLFRGKRHVCFTDGTISSEQHLSRVHKILRKIIFSRTHAFIGAGLGSLNLYRSYGVSDNRLFQSCLCVDNTVFNSQIGLRKEFDLMFSGQFVDRKMPFFFVQVAKKIKEKLGSCRVLMLGDGPLKEEVKHHLEGAGVRYCMPGFVQQDELSAFYARSKLFLFPTKNDPWGVVVNEAMAAGVPVITCENAGVGGDLVIHNRNGYIIHLDVDLWAAHIQRLLLNSSVYMTFSRNAVVDVQRFNYLSAANGILGAANFALNEK